MCRGPGVRRSVRHFGTGAALGFADAGVGFGDAMNRVIPWWQAPNRAFVDVVYASLAA